MLIVAEIAASHNGSLDRALKTIDAAADAGATAIKLQTWADGTMCIADRKLQSGAWAGWDMRTLYEIAWTPWHWHEQLFEHARNRGLIPFSTPFDRASVDFLETLDCPIYKVASFEITDLPLIRYIASKGKPMIISTGMATEMEIADAYAATWGAAKVTMLRCVSSYPAPAEEYNLQTMIEGLAGCEYGLSDHSMTSEAAVIATALGATVIEKHLCLSRADGGPDSGFSLEPHEFAEHVEAIRRTQAIIGKVQYGPMPSEVDSLQFRRSLWIAKDMKAGDVFTPDNLVTARPNEGMAPKYYEYVIGSHAICDISAGSPLAEEMLADPHCLS